MIATSHLGVARPELTANPAAGKRERDPIEALRPTTFDEDDVSGAEIRLHRLDRFENAFPRVDHRFGRVG